MELELPGWAGRRLFLLRRPPITCLCRKHKNNKRSRTRFHGCFPPLNATARAIAHGIVGCSLTSRADVFSARLHENLLRPAYPLGAVAMHRQQDAAGLYAAFVALSLVFRNAHSYQ